MPGIATAQNAVSMLAASKSLSACPQPAHAAHMQLPHVSPLLRQRLPRTVRRQVSPLSLSHARLSAPYRLLAVLSSAAERHWAIFAQCICMSTAQKVSDLPASLQKIVGAFQMVSGSTSCMTLQSAVSFYSKCSSMHSSSVIQDRSQPASTAQQPVVCKCAL